MASFLLQSFNQSELENLGYFFQRQESEICNNGGRGMSISEDGTVCKMRGCVVYGCSNGVYVYNKALIHMEENYVHSNLDTGLSVHHEGTTAQISRNYVSGTSRTQKSSGKQKKLC